MTLQKLKIKEILCFEPGSTTLLVFSVDHIIKAAALNYS